MKINLKSGIDKLLFGMKQNDVIAIYGKPDKNYKDEDDNLILENGKMLEKVGKYAWNKVYLPQNLKEINFWIREWY